MQYFTRLSDSCLSQILTPLDRLFDPIAACLTPEVAQRIVSVQTDDASLARRQILRTKANLGLLTADERSEYEDFVESLDLVAIFKAKVRALRAKHPS